MHTYIHTYIHAYIHTYMHACMHTYIHTLHTYIDIYNIHIGFMSYPRGQVHSSFELAGTPWIKCTAPKNRVVDPFWLPRYPTPRWFLTEKNGEISL